MSKQMLKRTLPIALGVTVPVLMLAGCPGLFGATTPSPTPTTATAALRQEVVFTKVAIGGTGDKDRTITVKNLTGSKVDLAKWVVSYESNTDTDADLEMVHARIQSSTGTAPSIDVGGELIFEEDATCSAGNCIKLESTLGNSAGVERLGIQASAGGSLVLYKGIASAAAITTGTMTDYMQYGTDRAYTHEDAAVTAKLWTKDAVAPALAAPGSLSAKTPGATDSANW